jgi:hypothetical protein
MAQAQASDDGEVEFFGVKLKVKNPRLAALLNSNVTEDVQVIGRRACEALRAADDPDADLDAGGRVLHVDDSVSIRLDEAEEL